MHLLGGITDMCFEILVSTYFLCLRADAWRAWKYVCVYGCELCVYEKSMCACAEQYFFSFFVLEVNK